MDIKEKINGVLEKTDIDDKIKEKAGELKDKVDDALEKTDIDDKIKDAAGNVKDKAKEKAEDLLEKTDIDDKIKEKVYDTMIPRNIKLSEAPSDGLCIFDYDPRSTGARAYAKLAKEVVMRNGGR